MTKVTDALGNETSYTYDVEENIKTVKNAQGNVCQYVYNESNKVVEIEDFDGSKAIQEYNIYQKIIPAISGNIDNTGIVPVFY